MQITILPLYNMYIKLKDNNYIAAFRMICVIYLSNINYK